MKPRYRNAFFGSSGLGSSAFVTAPQSAPDAGVAKSGKSAAVRNGAPASKKGAAITPARGAVHKAA